MYNAWYRCLVPTRGRGLADASTGYGLLRGGLTEDGLSLVLRAVGPCLRMPVRWWGVPVTAPSRQLNRVVVGRHLREGAELVRVPPSPGGSVGEHLLRRGRAAVEGGGLPRWDVVRRLHCCVVRSSVLVLLVDRVEHAGATNGPHGAPSRGVGAGEVPCVSGAKRAVGHPLVGRVVARAPVPAAVTRGRAGHPGKYLQRALG